MFSVRAPYVVPIVNKFVGVRVGSGPSCANDSQGCVGDRPAGAVTGVGYVVLVGAPLLGAVAGCALAGMPLVGALALGAVGAVSVLNDSSGMYGMRRKVCCSPSGHWEEQ